MAGIDPKKQLFSLIRDFASEKSQGERRVVGLKRQTEELQLELQKANTELEEAKRFIETTEQELKGYELELALKGSTIQSIESRISLIQDEVSTVGSELEALKNEKEALRNGFISQMYELNATIREFQRTKVCDRQKEKGVRSAAGGDLYNAIEPVADHNFSNKEVTELALTTLEDMLAEIVSQTAKEKEEYLEQENIQKQAQLELIDLEKKVSLMEVIMKETKALQDLTRQTSDLEQMCASLGEQLQKRCICPSCNTENVEALGGIVEASEEN